MASKSVFYPPHIIAAAKEICRPDSKPDLDQAIRFFQMVADFRGTSVDTLLIDTAKRNDPELVNRLLDEMEVPHVSR